MQPSSRSAINSGNKSKGAPAEITGFVLAGGRSSRLGRDKALLPWPPSDSAEENGQTLLQHSIVRLQSVCATVSICANRDDLSFAGAIIPDALPGSGPLGGIVAALEYSTTDWNLMLAVDLPYLPVEALQALAAFARSEEDPRTTSALSSLPPVACVLPQLDGLPQPLCGLYHRALAPGLRASLEAGKFKVMTALREACDFIVPSLQSASLGFRIELWNAAVFAAALPSAPNPSEWFLNINTPEDWQKARQLRFR
ncbi:MAG TPA: molybdenum cofactor guanylyltransferase [Acidobacteriaceae bacterium]|nr:molybdenum cofactor guanylyltransferase [Acidobacteriaceae bacterium]